MSTDFAWSLALIAGGFLLTTLLGFGPAYWLLPQRLRSQALLTAPPLGYALFSLAAILVSANFHLPAAAAIWIAVAILGVASAAALARALRRHELRMLWQGARPGALALPAMIVVMFWPVLYQGASLYLGTANPDFYQSLAYQETLVRFGIGALDPRPPIDYSLDPFFGTFPDPLAAKFGGVMFSLLLQKLAFVEPRTALMTALVVFLLTLPAATALFARAVLEAGDRVTNVTALLIAVSAPVTMSFIHVLVGQNSSLALIPLGLSLGFLAVRLRDWRALLLAFLVLDATFWIYVAVLPYIGAPLGLYAIYDLARNRRGALRWLAAAVALFGGTALLLQLGMGHESRQLVDDIVGLFGRANRSVYVDFLTEMSLPYSTGLSSYPLGSSLAMARVPTAVIPAVAAVYVAVAMAVLAFYFRCVAGWARRAAPEPRAYVIGTIAIYLAVWLYFNFIALYGYAIFKMASWLQFLFVPFIAWGLVTFLGEKPRESARARIDAAAAAAIGGLLVVVNLASSFDFDLKGLGEDTRKGAIVNSYGIGGNPDYPALERAVRSLPPGSVVAIAAPDFIANLWAAYYLVRGGMKASFVSHDDFPDEDVVLPDVVSGLVTNSAGNTGVYKPRYHAEHPDYLLLAGPANLNREIADQQPSLAPVWSDGTFILVETAKAHDVLLTRRGFYRLEYFDPLREAWWWPERMRWTPEGGEFLLLNASRPDELHRLSFIAVAGKERERPRHLDIYLNGEKIDEAEVHGAARVLTRPFRPSGGIDRLVVKVRETVGLEPRNFGLWNRHIATDQRFLNLVVTQARLERGEAPRAALAVPAELRARDLIDASRRFDGISLDGWVAPDAQIELAAERPVHKLRLRIEVPGWANFRFPFPVRMRVNGQEVARMLAAPGDHAIEAELGPATALSLQMEMPQSARVPGGGMSSFVLESLGVE